MSELNVDPGKIAGFERSPLWPAAEKAWLKLHPTCTVTGGKDTLNVHHIKPYHLHPELELDPTNFITLSREAHLIFGHLGLWSSYNENVVEDAAIWREKILNRPK